MKKRSSKGSRRKQKALDVEAKKKDAYNFWNIPPKMKVVLVVLVSLVLLAARLKGRNSGLASSDEEYPQMFVPKKTPSKRNTDSSPVWTPVHLPLVEKRPPRQCKISKIYPSVPNPLIYIAKENGKKWHRRAYACLDKCPELLISEFKSRRWKKISKPKVSEEKIRSWDATVVLVGSNTLQNLHDQDFGSYYELVFNREGISYINTLITGSLSAREASSATPQLQELFSMNNRVDFANSHGCEYSTLNMEQLKTSEKRKWLSFRKHTPVVRVHLLISSTMPFFVFTKLSHVSLKGARISLEEFQNDLAVEKITGSHYVDTLLYSSIKKSLLLVFHSIRQSVVRRRGSYLLATADFKIDSGFHVFLDNIEPHGDLKGLVSGDETAEALDLIQELNEIPVAFNSMVKGDKYGSWELLFSEKQESCERMVYNPCTLFGFNSRDLKKANSKVAKVHNTANRMRHEEARIAKKMEEQKKAMCREKKITYPSSRCDKMQQKIDQDKFEKLFAQHEKSFNPNQFVMAQPGQVFPWEIV